MLSNQELFAKGLATYRKVEAANYMAHREVYGLLHDALMDARGGFVFADLGCGTATGSASALAGTPVGRYVGVDISEPSLAVAREALGGLACPIELRLEDFPQAIQNWQGPLDVVWIGQSLHHLRAPEKRVFMRRVADLLPANSLGAEAYFAHEPNLWSLGFGEPKRDEWVILEAQEANAEPILEGEDMHGPPGYLVAAIAALLARQHDDVLVGARMSSTRNRNVSP